MLAGKPKTVAELCERIFPTVRPMDLYLAYSEILGFLMYLEDLNRVERLPGRLRERWALVPILEEGGLVYALHSARRRV